MENQDFINLKDYEDFFKIDEKFRQFIFKMSESLIKLIDYGLIINNKPIKIDEFLSIKRHNSSHSQYFIVKKDGVKIFSIDITHMMPHNTLLDIKYNIEKDIKESLLVIHKWIKEKYSNMKIPD